MFHGKHRDAEGFTRNRDAVVLAPLLRECGLSEGLLSPLLSHAEAVRADADRLGLVSIADATSIVPRHTADSMLFAKARAPGARERWVDVGSGAGFPGLVLAICYPEATFTLVEPQRRRAGFLEMQRARLDLDNVEVAIVRESAVFERFDVAVARALSDPTDALRVLCRLAPLAIVAAGSNASLSEGAREIVIARPGVDSPGRLFMMDATLLGSDQCELDE